MNFNDTLQKLRELKESNINDPKNIQTINYDAVKDAQKIKAIQQKLKNNKKLTLNQVKDPSGTKIIGYNVIGHTNDIKLAGLQ